jgi:hypothetical protein
MIQIQIRWKGGATTSLERPLPQNAADLFRTPASIVEMVRALAANTTDNKIAQTLNARDLRSGKAKRFTSTSIKHIRASYGIESLWQCFRKTGWLTQTEVAEQLGTHPKTARRFATEGILRAIRANDKGEFLFEPIIGPLPKAHPGKRFRDRRRYLQNMFNIPNEVQYEA